MLSSGGDGYCCIGSYQLACTLVDHQLKLSLSNSDHYQHQQQQHQHQQQQQDKLRALLSSFPVTTRLSLTGSLVVARDIAHAKLLERIESGEVGKVCEKPKTAYPPQSACVVKLAVVEILHVYLSSYKCYPLISSSFFSFFSSCTSFFLFAYSLLLVFSSPPCPPTSNHLLITYSPLFYHLLIIYSSALYHQLITYLPLSYNHIITISSPPAQGLPQYAKDYMIYYAGPAKTPEGYSSGSFGPTTAGRMVCRLGCLYVYVHVMNCM